MATKQHNQIREELTVLNNHFQQLLLLLKSSNQKKVPVHIVFGNYHAGKTNLIRASELTFSQVIPAVSIYKKDLVVDSRWQNPSQEQHNFSQTENEYCRWWVNEQGIFLDIPGSFLMDNENGQHEQAVHVQKFRRLLKFLKRNKKYLVVHSILCVISVPDLVQLEKNEPIDWLPIYKEQLITISQALKIKLPLYFIITKCDFLMGFNEFFDDLRVDERGQCFGCPLTSILTAQPQGTMNPVVRPLTDIFNCNFDYLLEQLNAHSVNRIHHERNLSKRALIQEFPLQFQTLQRSLVNLIADLGEKAQYCDAAIPQGIYFTSSEQANGPCIDRLHASLSSAYELQQKPYETNLTPISRPYFINALLSDLLSNPTELIRSQHKLPALKIFAKFNNSHLLVASLCVISLVGSGLLFSWQYHRDKQILVTGENLLQSSQVDINALNPQPATIDSTVVAINKIQQAKSLLDKASSSWLFRINFMTRHFKQNTNDAYLQTLDKLLLPQLRHALEERLLDNGTTPDNLYPTLKAYLMLNNPAKRQNEYLIQWANNYWRKYTNGNPALEKTLVKAITDLLTNQLPEQTLNPLAIMQARTTLNSLPKSYLAYLVIKDNAKIKAGQDFSINNFLVNTTTAKPVGKVIPYLYTVNGFKSVFLTELTFLNHSNSVAWILSEDAHSNPFGDITLYNDQIFDLYFKDYVNWWRNFANTGILPQFHTLSDGIKTINALTAARGTLRDVLHAINYNISPASLLTNIAEPYEHWLPLMQQCIDKNFDQNFLSINATFMNFNNNSAYDAVITNLKKLATYLSAVQSASNKPETAFQFAVMYATQKANNDPLTALYALANQQTQPIQDWLTAVSDNSWRIIMELTKNYINQRWQEDVVPQYSGMIYNRYPVFRGANSDISLRDFKEFFSQSGILARFFNHYLQPFMDTESLQWHWKNIHGQLITTDNTIPQLFERARIIRQMFFSGDADSLEIHFTLLPTYLAPNVSRMQLSIHGQTIQITPGYHAASQFTWPIINADDAISMLINDGDQVLISDNKSGPFALFRVLADGQIQATNDPKRYNLTFSTANGVAVQYQLTAENVINPFIPNIIDQFRVPTSL